MTKPRTSAASGYQGEEMVITRKKVVKFGAERGKDGLMFSQALTTLVKLAANSSYGHNSGSLSGFNTILGINRSRALQRAGN
jgi:hypothetical protein